MANPEAYDAESIILSSMLRNVHTRRSYMDKVVESDFHDLSHRKTFNAMVAIEQNQGLVDQDNILEQLEGEASHVRMQAILLFSNDVPVMDDQTFKSFKEDGVRVRLQMLNTYIGTSLRQKKPTLQILNSVHEMMDRVEGNTLLNVTEPEDGVANAIEEIDRWVDGDVKIVTGIPEVDEKLFLRQLLGYTLMGGDPSAGKTTLMTQIIRHNAELDIASAVFTLEMSREQLYRKMALSDRRLEGRELTEETLKDSKFIKLFKKCLKDLERLPIYIVDSLFNINAIHTTARKLSVSRKVRLVALDYIQLCETENPTATEYQVVSKVSKTLNRLKKPDIANGYCPLSIIALSQYSREGKKDREKNKRGIPKNSGLKGSSQLEQDADIIFHLINLDDEPENLSGDDWTPPDIARVKLYCGKNREGMRGWVVNAQYDKPKQQFLTKRLSEGEAFAPSRPLEF